MLTRFIFPLCIVAMLLAPLYSNAQKQYAFRVSFTDKKGTLADIKVPNTFLSPRALSRRSIQSIDIDSTDLPVAQEYIDSVLSSCSGIFHTRSKWQNNCVILVEDTSTINVLRSKRFVKEVTYVAVFLAPLHFLRVKPGSGSPAEAFQDPVPEQANVTKSLKRTTGGPGYYGDAYDQIKLANGDYLHDRGFRGANKMIAVIDEGFQFVNTLPGFDSLRRSGRIADTYNFNIDTGNVYGYSAHGTMVLSTMAGILNGQYVGTAPDAMYALYVTENSSGEQPFEMDNMVAAMERADSVGADIITISLGYNSFNIGSLNADLRLSDIDGKSTVAAMGANTATKKGILVAASAGNDGGTSWAKILTPGDADSALTCGSVDINRIPAGTSGRGPNAAGIQKPDVCMLGAPGVVFNNSGTTSSVGGTSIATPELAGLAACLWQSKPSATPYQLRKAIRESGHIAGSPNNEAGYGVPDFGKASLSISDTAPYHSGPAIVKPNPFQYKTTITLQTGKSDILNWIVYDIQGRKITEGNERVSANTVDFDITLPLRSPSGAYFLQLQADDYKETVRLLKE